MSFFAQFLSHTGRRCQKWPHYFPVYERYFSRFVNRPVSVLEIGVDGGGSLQLWKGYFGPHAAIVGIDINPACAAYEESQISVRIGSQSDPAFLLRVVNEFGPFDVIIDDGSHQQGDIIAAMRELYGSLNAGGVYLVEDLHTSYWDSHAGGLKKPGTFIEQAKDLIDLLNVRYHGETPHADAFASDLYSIHFYDSVAVFEKGRVHTDRDLIRPIPPSPFVLCKGDSQ